MKALSQHFFQATTRRDFRALSGSFKCTLETFIPEINNIFPSEYHLLKETDLVETFTLFQGNETKQSSSLKDRMNSITDAIGAVQVKMEQECKGSFEISKLKYAQVNDMRKLLTGAPTLGAKIKGSHSDHLEIQKQSLKERYNLSEYGNKIIELHCGDGARHSNNVLGTNNIIPFSTQLFNKKIQDLGVTTSSSNNIFTHMQVQGKEESRTVLGAVALYFQDRKNTLENKAPFGPDCKYYQYETGDVKMLNMSLGLVSFNKIQGGCMYCKCNKREGVTNPDHECELLSDEEHKKTYKNAQTKFAHLTERAKDKSNVNDAQILKILNDWAGKFNYGITGLGIDLEILPISMIRPDVMHLCMAVTKTLIKYMCTLISARTNDCCLEIEEIMYEFLTDEEILIWKLNKSLDSYEGSELRKFTKNFGFLSKEIKKRKIVSTTDTKWFALLNAMSLWSSLSDFVLKAEI